MRESSRNSRNECEELLQGWCFGRCSLNWDFARSSCLFVYISRCLVVSKRDTLWESSRNSMVKGKKDVTQKQNSVESECTRPGDYVNDRRPRNVSCPSIHHLLQLVMSIEIIHRVSWVATLPFSKERPLRKEVDWSSNTKCCVLLIQMKITHNWTSFTDILCSITRHQ